ncbi:hypothetical protein BFU36_13035 [Sulfolobus sp. A20]|uniref:hypothetical protein n=1 Tax=Saccharolobus sp. A20 TaxID=1891280 RepID=UPI000845E15A|nr:hypothetical protein [Sulfolobus sp. A20]TRM78088.1 hypothetical protein DJ532_02430 [Sulfolobus sp. A20-N-F8]TRM78802.1 hypothetical protein DJ528_04160 [Sulfolobus sp. B5]TRM82478.1 hypothetical protein DJ524_00290 [Sulfolobus sp. D5]TRM83022.1 hypothetical protein DJ531_07330 [Sulfolobus sp. A20-N-F6]TRM94773.1 hypothetical protein DJ526_01720 [Sulfolobus sp. A20-N-G8]TRN04041.1 hypothetical protein DJ530_01765 [Sulfolobus sp. E1]
MPIIVRKTHNDNGKKIYIRVGESPPIVKDGKIKDGAFFIIVGDSEGEKSIRLTDQEALDIAQRIIIMYHSHVRVYRKLDRKVYEEYKEMKNKDARDLELENEILKFLLKSGGESTVEEVRNMLGIRYADYLNQMEMQGLVEIIGNRVIVKREKSTKQDSP